MSHASLPFKVTLSSEELHTQGDVFYTSTTRTILGLLRLEDDRLCLQLGESRARQEITGDGYRTHRDEHPVVDRELPLTAIAEARLERRWFGRRLCLVANDLRTFEGLPGAQGVELRLPIARAHRARAEELLGALSLALADLALARAERTRLE